MSKSQKNKPGNEQEKLLLELAQLKAQLRSEINKRKKLESAVLPSEKDSFHSLIKNTSDVIVLVDETGIVSYTSPAIRAAFSYEENELIGKNLFEYIFPDDVNLLKKEFNKTIDHEGIGEKIHCRFLHKSGHLIAVEAQGNNLLNTPAIKQFVVNFKDISSGKRSEKERMISEEQKNTILSTIQEAYIAVDKDWNVTYLNKRANILFNRPGKKIEGTRFWTSFDVTLEKQSQYISALTNTKTSSFETFHEKMNKWLKVKIYSSDHGASLFYSDITEEKIQLAILQVEQTALLENNKREKRLNEIFNDAIRKMESILPGLFCSICLVSENKKTLTNFSAPSIGREFLDATEGIEIADNLISAPTAAFRKQICITTSIPKDPNWKGYRDLAAKENYLASWAFPVNSSKGDVLAVLAIYFKKEIQPTPLDLLFYNKICIVVANLLEERKKEDEINKLSLIAKNTSKAVFITDLDQRITWVNAAFTEITGYSFEEVQGKKPIKLLEGAKSDPDTMLFLKRQMVDLHPFIVNAVFHKKNGEFYWSRTTGQPMLDESGNTTQYFVIQEDTSSKKLAKIDLQDSEKRYRALFHSNSQPMFIYDKATLQFTEVNEAAVNTYGYTPDEFNEMKTSDLLEDSAKSTYDPANDKINYRKNILNSNDILTELLVHQTKSGKLINAEIIRNEMIISGKASILAIINDVTKKLKTEKKLLDSNERFALASKAVNEAIWDLNLISNKLEWGDGMSHLFGYSDISEYPSISNWSTFIHPDDYLAAKINFDQTLVNPSSYYWDYEYRFLKKDKTYAFILDRAYILRDEQKKPIRVIGAMQDITKQKNFELQKLLLISETQEHERKRFSMELHDGLAQHLVALNLYLSQIDEDQIVDPETLKNCFDILKISMNQTRALCYSLTPPELDQGFILALQAMFERLKVLKAFEVQLSIHPSLNNEDFKETDTYNLYRIIQEFVNNSIKHSQCSLISCEVVKISKVVTISVMDDGNGFDLLKKSNSLGLRNIEQRAQLANIHYSLNSQPTIGTTIKIELMPKR
jgi:PAS domain S-box-containing protein